MTVNDLNKILTHLIEEGNGEMPIFVNDAEGFNTDRTTAKVYADCMTIEKDDLWG